MSSKIIGVKGQIAAPTGWQRPSGWPDISEVCDNEIRFLYGEGRVYFELTISGTFSVDWGDGTQSHNCTGATIIYHEFSANGIWCPEGYGYWVWPVRIYNATAPITLFRFTRSAAYDGEIYFNALWVVMGTKNITSWLYGGASIFQQNTPGNKTALRAVKITSWGTATSLQSLFLTCYTLEHVELPETWGEVTTTNSMFRHCYLLKTVDLPKSWGKVTNVADMFSITNSLVSVNLPDSWNPVTNASGMFNASAIQFIKLPDSFGSLTNISSMFGQSFIKSIKLPVSMGNVTTINNLFTNCKQLISCEFPANWGGVTNMSQVFMGCNVLTYIKLPPQSAVGTLSFSWTFGHLVNLRQIENLPVLGENSSSQISFDNAFINNGLPSLELRCALSKLIMRGTSTAMRIPVNSIRLLSAISQFSGASPQIDIRWCDLSDTALNMLFGDLPTLTGKTINITGCTGAATCNKSIATAKGWTVTG